MTLRVPGTKNWLTPGKRDAGREPYISRVWASSEIRYTPGDFDRFQAPGEKSAPASGAKATGGIVTEGGRHNHVVCRAAQLRGSGLVDGPLEAALLALNATECRPPLDEAEVRQIAADYSKKPRKAAGRASPKFDPKTVDLVALAPSAERMLEILKSPEPQSPLPGYLDPDPNLHVCVGLPKSGKTTLALSLARCWALGEQPWRLSGAAFPGTRALILSKEQSTRRILQVLQRMDRTALHPSRGRWTERLTVLGRDQANKEARSALILDDAYGLAVLRNTLQQAKGRGDPFGFVVIDSLSRTKPLDVEENDNDGMTRFLDGLVDVAQEFGVYILLIHHTGKGEPGSAVLSGRGASAIGAVAAAVWLMERAKPRSLQRTLMVEGNMIPEAEHRFLVADPGREGYIDFWRPCVASEGVDASSFFKPGEHELTAGDLFERIAGLAYDKASTSQKQRAHQIRDQLVAEGALMERAGPRNSKLYSLPMGAETDSFEGEPPEPGDLH